MALQSQQLLEKYRAEEKAAQGQPANPEQTNAETETTTAEATPTGEANAGGTVQPSSEKTAASNGESGNGTGDDRFGRLQSSFEKRLNRQERSHRKTVDALNAEIAELKKQLGANGGDLKREDFPTLDAYESYRNEQLKKQAIDEFRAQQAQQEEVRKRREANNEKMDRFFRTPEQKKDFQDTIADFCDDNEKWLESEEGLLYQEIIDQSPVGLVMAMAIAKNEQVTEQMKHWSKDLLYQRLAQFESTLMQRAKEAPKGGNFEQGKQPDKPTTSGIPSTGSVGKTQAPSSFNAKEWLRKNRPERYTH